MLEFKFFGDAYLIFLMPQPVKVARETKEKTIDVLSAPQTTRKHAIDTTKASSVCNTFPYRPKIVTHRELLLLR